MSLWEWMLGALVPAAGVGGVVLNGWWAKRGGREATEVQAVHNQAVEWEAHAKEIRAWTETRLATMQKDLASKDERIVRLETALEARDTRIDRLEDEMREVRRFVDELQRKYNSAIAYIRRLHSQLSRHVNPEDLEAPPDDIAADL